MNKLALIVQIVVFYAVVAAIVYFISNYSIFVPPDSSYSDHERITKIATGSGRKISAIFMPNPNSNALLIYSHGNAEDLGMIEEHAESLHALGFAVLAYDYDGYGTSEGTPSEQATYDDIHAVYNYAVQKLKFEPKQVVLYGRSVGGGPSIDLATKNKVGAIILESPFVSAYRVVTYYPLFPFDKYNNLRKINSITAPILFIHGTKDDVIPIWHGKKLYDTYTGSKESYWVEGASHNDIAIVGGSEYLTKIKDFIKKYLEV